MGNNSSLYNDCNTHAVSSSKLEHERSECSKYPRVAKQRIIIVSYTTLSTTMVKYTK
jgi:hypothetical protein